MSDLSDRLRAALADRYVIERELGRGGMAIVYLAEDRRHQRKVALKVLRPELAASLGAERFLREIRTAAQLTHPNILPLHDSGEADGTLYYTMPFVDGDSLRDRLNREKQLPIEDALQITREVADALGYAHEQGIVHRDIKPENILVQSGHAVVADFGIARAVSAAGAETLTETGLAVGTPAYMSPEQGVGSGKLDGRSDLYSLGCVLYEMLSGEPPYAGLTAQAIIAKKLSEPTPRVSVVRDRVPVAVEAALDRVLARNAVDRFATASDFATALSVAAESARTQRRPARRLAILATLAIAIVASGAYGAWWFFTTGRPGTLFAAGVVNPGDRVLLADFVNRTDDTALADAVHDEILVALSDNPHLVRLVGRAEVRETLQRMGLDPTTRLREETAREVAERAGAKAFVIGQVARLGSGYQFTIGVVGMADGRELLLERETAIDDSDVIDAVDRLAGRLRRRIGESVRSVTSRPNLAEVTTSSIDALRAYSVAIRLPFGPQRLAMLREAIALDSTFAAAYVRLAAMLGGYARPEEARLARAEAFRLRHRLPQIERLFVEASYHYSRLEYEARETALLRILDRDPLNASALTGLADLRLVQRRFAQAESLALRAIEIAAPESTSHRADGAYWNAVEAQVAQNRFEEAYALLATAPPHRRALEVFIRMAAHDWGGALAFAESYPDRHHGAVLLALRGRLHEDVSPIGTELRWRPIQVMRYTGDTTRAIHALETWRERTRWDTLPPVVRPYWILIPTLAEIGRISQARELLRQWHAAAPDDPGLRSDLGWSVGAIAVAEGRLDSAASAFLGWHEAPIGGDFHRFNKGLAEAAMALDRAGRPDTAMVLYERALEMRTMGGVYYEAQWYPLVVRRLGELHDSLGHRDEAIDYYGKFVDLWKDADPELQPQVEEARAAVARLTEERRE